MDQSSISPPDKPWALPWQEVLESLGVSRDKGLNEPLHGEVPLAEQSNMLFRETSVTCGLSYLSPPI